MFRRRSAMWLAGTSLALVFSIGSVTAADYNLTFAHILTVDTPAHKAAERMADLVAERSDGRIEISIHPAGELGTDTEIVEQIQMDAVQLGFPPVAVLGQFEPRMQLFSLPFIFPTADDAYTVLDGDIGQELLDSLDARGLKGLAYWESGFKQMTSNDGPILEPADLEGKTFRVMDSPLLMEQYRTWGASPVPIAFAEVYTALQLGVADAQENPLVSIYNMKFFEVQDYLTRTDHAYLSYALVMSKPAWDNLPEDLQQVMLEVSEETRDWQRDASQSYNEDLIDRMSDGIEIVELPDEGRQKFIEASRDVHEAFEEVIGRELLDRVYEVTGQGGQ